MFAFLEDLNDQQREAVTYDGPALRVLAGPGTGKTTTLSARTANLLTLGVSPERVLLLTFSRRAARVMMARSRQMAAAERRVRGQSVTGGTFHAIAHHAIRHYAVNLGVSPDFSLLDQADAADVLDLVRAERRTTTSVRRGASRATLASIYSRSVNMSQTVQQSIADVAPWCSDDAEEYAAVFRAYVARKRALALLDFDDLLLYWRALVQDDQLGSRFASGFDHVLIDEYQDVNAAQVDIATSLAQRGCSLTLVGDDAQAIYGFRGSSPRYLIEADESFAGLHTVTLETNYRSTQEILNVANQLAREAPVGFSAILTSHQPDVQALPVRVVQCGDEDSQTAFVCDQVLENLEHGVRLQDQVVVFRTAHHSAHLELELTRRRIPYVKYGGLRYLEAAHVKDLLALYRIADNGRDSPAWFRLLRLLPGVGPVTARRIVDSLEMDAQLESRTPMDRAKLVRDLLPAGALQLFDPLLDGLAISKGDTVPLRADRLRSAIEPLLCAVYEDADVRLVDLDALVDAASQCARLSDVSSLFVLEPTSSTGDLADDPSIDEDWLVLSTIHSAKGLEFHSVFVIHAADGNIPADMALTSDEGLEEERRLLYVALTRARRQLTITVPLRFHHKPPKHPDAHSWALPSRFLTPAVCELLTWSSVGCEEAAPDVGSAATPTAITASVELLLTDLFGSATS